MLPIIAMMENIQYMELTFSTLEIKHGAKRLFRP